jgi:hypothetical protein
VADSAQPAADYPGGGYRQILLDGLAREYAGVESRMAYVKRENR